MALDNLGHLSVLLTLNMAGFVAGMRTAQGQVTSLSAAVQANSAVFKTAGRNMLIAGAAITAALAFSVKAAMDFEKQMAFVNSMLTTTTEHFLPSFSTELRAMAIQYGQTTESLTKGTYDVLSAQVAAGDAMNFMTIAAKAAVGGFTSVDVATDALLTIMKTFKGEIKSITDAADWMHSVVERGRITFEGLAGSIGTTAAMAAQAGMTIEDYGTAISVLTKGGLSAEKSQTALRGILRSVLKVQDEAIDTAKEMGLEWNVNALRGDNFVKTLQKLNGAQIEYLSKLSPNIRGLLGWAVALSDVNEALLDHTAILNRAGLTQKKFEKATTTLSFQWDRLKAAIFDSRVVIGTALVPAMKDLIKVLIDASGKVSKFAEENKKLFGWIIKVTAAIGGMLIPIGFLLMSFPGLILLIERLGWAYAALTTKIIISNGFLMSHNALLLGVIGVITIAVYKVIELADAWWKAAKANKAAQEAQENYINSTGTALSKAIAQNNKLLRERADTLTDVQKQEIKQNSVAIISLLKLIEATKQAGGATEEEEKQIHSLTIRLLQLNGQLKNAITNNKTLAEVQEEGFKVSEENLIKQIKRKAEYREWEKKLTLESLEGVAKRVKAIEFEKNATLKALKEKTDMTDLEYEIMSQIIIDYYALQTANTKKVAEETGESFKFMEKLATQSAANIQNAFSNFFFKAFKGELQSAKEAFAEFGDAVLQMMANLAAKWVALQIMTGIKTGLGMLFGGGVASSSPGLASAVSSAGSASSSLSAWVPPTTSFATGTDFVPSTGLYQLHKGEAVVPTQENARSGETIVQPIVVIQAWDSRDVSRNMETLSTGLAQSLRSNSNFREAIKKYSR